MRKRLMNAVFKSHAPCPSRLLWYPSMLLGLELHGVARFNHERSDASTEYAPPEKILQQPRFVSFDPPDPIAQGLEVNKSSFFLLV